MRDQIKKAAITVASTHHGLAAEITLLFVLPLFLVKVFPVIVHLRHLVMLLSLTYIFLLVRTSRLSRAAMGLTFVNTWPASLALIAPSLVVMIFTLTVSQLEPSVLMIPALVKEQAHLPLWAAVLGYTLISVPLQEIIFRAFYLPRLELITSNKYFLILFSASLFALMHIPLGNWMLVVTTAYLGIIWADNFLKFRNLPAIMLSHSVVGTFLWIISYAILT